MPAQNRLNSVCHSIAHHGASGLSYAPQHVADECAQLNIDRMVFDLLLESPFQESTSNNERLVMAMRALHLTFRSILDFRLRISSRLRLHLLRLQIVTVAFVNVR